jgi:hypothetical protein
MGNIVSVCSLPDSPLNLSFQLRPPWNNVHNTFPTDTMPDTRMFHHSPQETKDIHLKQEASLTKILHVTFAQQMDWICVQYQHHLSVMVLVIKRYLQIK